MTGFALKWFESMAPGGREDVTLYCDAVALAIGRGADRAAALRDCWSMLIELGEGNGAAGYVADELERVTGVALEERIGGKALLDALSD